MDKHLLGPDLYRECSGGVDEGTLEARYNALKSRPCSIDEFKALCGGAGSSPKASGCLSPLNQFKWKYLENMFDECTSGAPLPLAVLQATATRLNLPVHKLLLACGMENIVLSNGRFKLTDAMRDSDNKHKQFKKSKQIGRGTYGQVWLDASNKVAIKELQKIDMNELDVLMRFKHPNVLAAQDFYFEGNVLNLVLPLARCDLGSLFDPQAFTQPVTESTKKRYIQELISAMAFLQSQGFFHCDLKPGNVLMFPKDSSVAYNSTNPDDYKMVLADMSLCYPFLYEHQRTDVCGSRVFNAFERQAAALNTSKNRPILANDMFLLGNVCLFILKNRFIHDYKTDVTLEANIVAHLADPVVYLQNILGLYGSSSRWFDFFRELFQILPQDRPTSYASLISLIPAPPTSDTLATGYAEYNNLIGDFQFSPSDKEALGKAVHKLYSILYNAKRTHYKHDVMFTGVELLYRFWSKARGIINMEDSAAACAYVALHLSGYHKAIPVSFMPYVKSVIIALNGQLRYPYIMELMKTKQDIIGLLDMAKTNPDVFITVIANPIESPLGSLSDLSIVTDIDSVVEVESILLKPGLPPTCPICGLTTGAMVELPCGHSVHRACFVQRHATQNTFTCPSCGLDAGYVVPELIENYLRNKWGMAAAGLSFTQWLESGGATSKEQRIYKRLIKKEEHKLTSDQLRAIRWQRFQKFNSPVITYDEWLNFPLKRFRNASQLVGWHQPSAIPQQYWFESQRKNELRHLLTAWGTVRDFKAAAELIDGLTTHNPQALIKVLQIVGDSGDEPALEFLFVTFLSNPPPPNDNDTLFKLLEAGEVKGRLLENIADFAPTFMLRQVIQYKLIHKFKADDAFLGANPIFVALINNDTVALSTLFDSNHLTLYESDETTYDLVRSMVAWAHLSGKNIPVYILNYFFGF